MQDDLRSEMLAWQNRRFVVLGLMAAIDGILIGSFSELAKNIPWPYIASLVCFITFSAAVLCTLFQQLVSMIGAYLNTVEINQWEVHLSLFRSKYGVPKVNEFLAFFMFILTLSLVLFIYLMKVKPATELPIIVFSVVVVFTLISLFTMVRKSYPRVEFQNQWREIINIKQGEQGNREVREKADKIE